MKFRCPACFTYQVCLNDQNSGVMERGEVGSVWQRERERERESMNACD